MCFLKHIGANLIMYVTALGKGDLPTKVRCGYMLIGPKVSSSKISSSRQSPLSYLALCKHDSNPPATRAATCQQGQLDEPPSVLLWSNNWPNIVLMYLLLVLHVYRFLALCYRTEINVDILKPR